jgi:hypothetical protein
LSSAQVPNMTASFHYTWKPLLRWQFYVLPYSFSLSVSLLQHIHTHTHTHTHTCLSLFTFVSVCPLSSLKFYLLWINVSIHITCFTKIPFCLIFLLYVSFARKIYLISVFLYVGSCVLLTLFFSVYFFPFCLSMSHDLT